MDTLFTAEAILLFLVFIGGTSIASFAGLLIVRLQDINEDTSLLRAISTPPSNCDHCSQPLSAINLIPVVGWLLTRGRCKNCRGKIPLRYPIMEAATGTASVALAAVFSESFVTATVMLFMFWTLIVVAAIDWAIHIIPEELTWLLLFVGLFCSPLEPDLFYRVAGAAFGCGMIWLSLLITGWLKNEDTAAGGDVALAAALGAWFGIWMMPFVMLGTCISFAAFAIPRKRRGMDWHPMGPAFALTAVMMAPAYEWLRYSVLALSEHQ